MLFNYSPKIVPHPEHFFRSYFDCRRSALEL